MLVRGAGNGQPLLRMIDRSGGEVWSHVFTGSDTPVGLNFGRFRQGSSADIVASIVGVSGPRRTTVPDGSSGETIWTSDLGTYWDASFAIRSRPTSTATVPAKCWFPPPTGIFTRSVRGARKPATEANSLLR